MARKSKKLPQEISNLFQKANSSERQLWESNAQKSYEFFLGEQLTSEEKDELRNGGMPDFIINRITPYTFKSNPNIYTIDHNQYFGTGFVIYDYDKSA